MKTYSVWFKVKYDKSLQVLTMLGKDENDICERIAAMGNAILITDKGATNEQMLEMRKARRNA